MVGNNLLTDIMISKKSLGKYKLFYWNWRILDKDITNALDASSICNLEYGLLAREKYHFESNIKIWVQLFDSTQSTFLGNASRNLQKVLNRIQDILQRENSYQKFKEVKIEVIAIT